MGDVAESEVEDEKKSLVMLKEEQLSSPSLKSTAPQIQKDFGIRVTGRVKTDSDVFLLQSKIDRNPYNHYINLSSSEESSGDGENSRKPSSRPAEVTTNTKLLLDECKNYGQVSEAGDGDDNEEECSDDVEEEISNIEIAIIVESDEEADELSKSHEEVAIDLSFILLSGKFGADFSSQNTESDESELEGVSIKLKDKSVSASHTVDETKEFAETCSRIDNGRLSNAKALYLYRKGDHERAIHEWKWAAKIHGHIAAYFNLGVCFEKMRNTRKAVRYYSVAAEAGHKEANYNLGCLHLRNDDEEGVTFLKRSADLELKQAQTEYGVILMKQKENADSAETAANFLCLAAEQDYPRAVYFLGICYERGLGVPVNQDEAAILYKRASDANHPEAQHNLGVFYEHGLGGLVSSRQEAMKLYEEAEVNGHSESSVDVERLKNASHGLTDGITTVAQYATDNRLASADINVSAGQLWPNRTSCDVETLTPLDIEDAL